MMTGGERERTPAVCGVAEATGAGGDSWELLRGRMVEPGSILACHAGLSTSMDVKELEQEVREGRMDPECLLKLLVRQQRELAETQRKLGEAQERIRTL